MSWEDVAPNPSCPGCGGTSGDYLVQSDWRRRHIWKWLCTSGCEGTFVVISEALPEDLIRARQLEEDA